MNDFRSARLAFVKSLEEDGYLTSPGWVDAFAEIPRERFVPSFFVSQPDGRWRAMDATDPAYAGYVYADTTLTTQLDESIDPDPSAGPVAGVGTSSSTQPSLMAVMLEALEVEGGETVLEIGTGTGYNAALMSHRLGDRSVATVEVDAAVSNLARKRINLCGFNPTLRAGDGQLGLPERAPYDRIIATCSVPEIPRAWMEQTKNGGSIITSLWRDLGGGPLIRLWVNDNAAQGMFLSTEGGFMPVRSETRTAEALSKAVKQQGQKRSANLDSSAMRHPDAGLLIALFVRGVTWLGFEPEEGGEQLWLFAPDGSWSMLESKSGMVEQHGPRMLWDEVERAHALWERLGSPARTRVGLTVSPDGEQFWVDEPHNRI